MKPEEAISVAKKYSNCLETLPCNLQCDRCSYYLPNDQVVIEAIEVLLRICNNYAKLQSKIDSGELVEVVHSRKISIVMRETIVCDWKCVNCDTLMCDYDSYCPSCGAKMDSK